MTSLQEAVSVGENEQYLAVVSTLRADHTIQSSLVNAGILPHPDSGEPVLAFVTFGRVKLGNLRARPQISVTFRDGGRWATIEGSAQLAGPDDPRPWLKPEALPGLLREIFTAAGGHHDNWEEYDRVMAEQRRTAVLVVPSRIYSN
ncbi:TIGR03618 family F420-dependent PPOX class oxidoreductase [Streptosporangium sp. G11]|uniref:TIGR03618 family F420-dependent PPOX class oxidoreductase n=1 Tax=Streptosporangium sp. G11 TaxID=3436926 RepID=UPI003EBA0BAD